jgi:uncharacterized protein (TIGR03435 family)
MEGSMKLLLVAAALSLTIAPPGYGQEPAFEVASIKPNNSADHRTMIQMSPGGRMNANNVSVQMLITMAYGIKNNQISGAPGWVDSERYDISAKAEGTADQEQVKLMIQALLAERFKMKFHRETKEQPIYALVLDKGGPKFKESKGDDDDFLGERPAGPKPEGGRGPGMGGMRQGVRLGRGNLAAQGVTLSAFAGQLANVVGRQVIDKTGLTATYDLKLTWTPDEGQGMMRIPGDTRDAPPPAPADSGPSIFTALQEQLGLKLEAQKGPVEMYMIDHVEKVTEN